jgi:hypothetical protein
MNRVGTMGPSKGLNWRPTWLGLCPLLIAPAGVVVLAPPQWPPWAVMWMLALAIFAGCKWLSWQRSGVVGASWWRHLGYWLAWPGMDASAFLRSKPLPEKDTPSWSELVWAVGNCLMGGLLVWGVCPLLMGELVLGWVGMVGVVLMLHFGVFQMLSWIWRWNGVAALPLMNQPLASVSVTAFWGKRWNTAFRDLTHSFLFRPLAARWGPRPALVAGFFLSGLVHDLVISVSAGAGHGGPTLFFLIQAAAILFERSPLGKTLGLGEGWRGWIFTLLALIVPVFLLFHPPFIRNVMVPFMKGLWAI